MFKFVLLLTLISLAHEARSSEMEEDKWQKSFEDYIVKFGKVYPTQEEKEKRFKIYVERMEEAQRMNADESDTARYGETRFSDMTKEEFSAVFPAKMGAKMAIKDVEVPIKELPGDIPSSWNWCDRGDYCTEAKDQGTCGACWIFAAVEALESQWAITSGKLITLSTQQGVDCNSYQSGAGCCGGSADYLYSDIRQYTTEEKYPYVDGDKDYFESCRMNTHTCRYTGNYPVMISGYESPTFSGFDEFAEYLYKNGPFTTSISFENGLQSYVGGVYSCKSPIQYNHDVVAVGYGEENGEKYILLRNSWGKSWGLDGYFKVVASSDIVSNCGVGWNPLFSLASYSLNAKPNVLMNWTCDISHYGTGDGCHCNCGAYDPDCYDCNADVFGCEDFARAKCSDSGTCINISSWNCSACWYGDGSYCDCNCGSQTDPDCLGSWDGEEQQVTENKRFDCTARLSSSLANVVDVVLMMFVLVMVYLIL